MLNSLRTLIITLLFAFCLFSLALSQESITITTYYPSPFGSYNQLTTTGDTYLATAGGNVGIGTTAPQEILQLRSNQPEIGFVEADQLDKKWVIQLKDTNFDISEVGVADQVTILAGGGNVLIGTTVLPATSPKLYVYGGGVEADRFHAYETQGAYAFMERGTDDDWIVRLGGADVTSGAFVATQIDGAPLVLQERDPGLPRNVGIGTSNPGARLEIVSSPRPAIPPTESMLRLRRTQGVPGSVELFVAVGTGAATNGSMLCTGISSSAYCIRAWNPGPPPASVDCGAGVAPNLRVLCADFGD